MTVEVVVAGEDEAAGVGQSHRRDPGAQAAVLVADHLLVRAQVVHLAGAVVGARDDVVTVGEELRSEGGGEKGSAGLELNIV